MTAVVDGRGEFTQIEPTMVVAFFPGHLIRRIAENEDTLAICGHDLAIVHIGDLDPLEQFGKAPQADDLAMGDGLPRDDAGSGEPEAPHLRPTNDQATKKGRYGKVHQVTGIPPCHPQVEQFLGTTTMVGMDIKQPVDERISVISQYPMEGHHPLVDIIDPVRPAWGKPANLVEHGTAADEGFPIFLELPGTKPSQKWCNLRLAAGIGQWNDVVVGQTVLHHATFFIESQYRTG